MEAAIKVAMAMALAAGGDCECGPACPCDPCECATRQVAKDTAPWQVVYHANSKQWVATQYGDPDSEQFRTKAAAQAEADRRNAKKTGGGWYVRFDKAESRWYASTVKTDDDQRDNQTEEQATREVIRLNDARAERGGGAACDCPEACDCADGDCGCGAWVNLHKNPRKIGSPAPQSVNVSYRQPDGSVQYRTVQAVRQYQPRSYVAPAYRPAPAYQAPAYRYAAPQPAYRPLSFAPARGRASGC
jgi:hypothetical protein